MKSLSRRQFLHTLTALGVAAPTASYAFFSWQQSNSQSNERWLSAQGSDPANFGVGWANQNQSANTVSGFRGHGLAQNPINKHQVVMFARSPGTKGIVMNIQSGEIETEFTSPNNHHMHGHGCFSADGQYLFCTESNYQTGQGVIIVRNTHDFSIEHQLSSYGIGPHEIGLLPDGLTLVVANGGLLTHPKSGRKVLNWDTMRSSLSYIDSQTGNQSNELTLTEEKSSIRHLDIANNGSVAVAIQMQRKASGHESLVPLAAVHKVNATQLQTLDAPAPLTKKLNDYMGSVRIHSQNRIAGFTSPRGNMAMFWNLETGDFIGHHVFHDVCGLTISQNNQHFVLSNSSGKIRQLDATTLKEQKDLRLSFPNMRWDNHMITVATS